VQDPSVTDRELLTGLAEGRRDVAERIYRQHYPLVVSWIALHGGAEADAADIFQEAMVVLYEKACSDDFVLTCQIGTYLVAVSKRLWYKKFQNGRRNPLDNITEAEEDDPGYGVWDDDLEIHEERERHFGQLDLALQKLGEPCSTLLKAFYQDGKSMQEIAASFGYTNADNAKTQKYKCLSRLRKLFYGVQAK
jgi:RNA polymerase sigma factor (sigma-70 family)